MCRLINEEKRLYIHKVSESYSDVHDQLPPPLWRALQNFKLGTRIRLKAHVDLADQTAEFIPWEVIRPL